MSPSTFKLSEPSIRITAVKGIPEELARRWMRECGTWFAASSPERGAKGRIAWISSAARDVVVKRDERTSRRTLLCALVGRPARSTRAFRLGLALAESAVRTARPLALIERAIDAGKWESCLVMERITAPSLREYLLEELPRLSVEDPAAKPRLLRAVAVAIARMHRAAFRQRDLKAANLLIEPREGGGFEVGMIDFDGMKRCGGPPPWRVRVRDLARLRVSLLAAESVSGVDARDWERLVTEYLEAYGSRPPLQEEIDLVLAATGRWASRKIRRNRRRRRPVT
jgi:tRNA A-37 threonylcarbamoyl transferase component Bud32